MKTVRKILYFSSQFPTAAMPHMGMFSVQRVQALRNAGCEIIVISPVLVTLPARFLRHPIKLFQWVKKQIRLPINENVQGIQAYYPKWFWFPKGLFGWYTSYFLYRQVRKKVANLVDQFKPDIILSSWLPDGLAACKLGKMAGIPTIAIADGSDVNYLPRIYPGWSYACRNFNREGNTFVFVSKALLEKAHILGLHGGMSAVLYNGVDINLFDLQAPSPNNSVFSILGVGRLEPVKGYSILLNAFEKLYRQLGHKARLTLVGDGPLLKDLQQQATDLGILQAVDFVGGVRHEDIASYFQQADVFCLPSFSEGSPAVVVEAMACGKPVIASDVGGVGEMVNDDSGILVPAGDAECLYQALQQAKNRVWRPEVIRSIAENRFEWGKWTSEMLGIIETSIERKPDANIHEVRT